MNLAAGGWIICIRDQCRLFNVFNDTRFQEISLPKSDIPFQFEEFSSVHIHICRSFILSYFLLASASCPPPVYLQVGLSITGESQGKVGWVALCSFACLPLRTSKKYSISSYNTASTNISQTNNSVPLFWIITCMGSQPYWYSDPQVQIYLVYGDSLVYCHMKVRL